MGKVVLPNGIGMAQLGPSKNTKPERIVRMEMVRLGLRFECHPRVPGCPRRSADFRCGDTFVFVHGRFWHDPRSRSTSISSYWRKKVASNHRRDRSTQRILRRAGLKSIVIWDDALSVNRSLALRELRRLAARPSAS